MRNVCRWRMGSRTTDASTKRATVNGQPQTQWSGQRRTWDHGLGGWERNEEGREEGRKAADRGWGGAVDGIHRTPSIPTRECCGVTEDGMDSDEVCLEVASTLGEGGGVSG